MERDIQEVLLSEEQLRTRIAELGEELSRDYADKKPVIVGVLKGVVVFYADMIRQIKVPCEMDFMVISSYSGTETTGNVLVKKDVSVDLKDRHVLILEDIFDTGNSLDFVYNHLKAMEPASVKICTLLDKPERRKEGITLQADYVGFTIPNVFVVGYGLDFDEYYRNLPYVGIVKPEVYQK
jgi:hypoxanthine phosphoribosyltransferase